MPVLILDLEIECSVAGPDKEDIKTGMAPTAPMGHPGRTTAVRALLNSRVSFGLYVLSEWFN